MSEDVIAVLQPAYDPMGSARQAMNSAPTVIVRKPGAPSLLPAALPSGAQFAAAFFPPPTAFAGMPPPFLGTPSTDIFLPGAYPRPLDPTAYPLHYPYGMAIAKGSSLDSEGSIAKKPRTVFTPRQLLHLEEEFVKNQFPNMEQRKQIAKDLDLTQQHIQIWFQNRRAKKRRKKKRHSEEERMRRDPEPPPFWPSNLPFSSNIGDLTKKSPEDSPTTPAADCPSAQATGEAAASNNDRDFPHIPTTEHSPNHIKPPSPKSEHSAPSTLPPGEHTNSSSAIRPSHLPCKSQEVPLKSPTLALTPGNGHSQLPTPPSHVSPVTSLPATGSYIQSTIVTMMSHTSVDVIMAPPGDLGLHSYPPLPPPESLLAGHFHEHSTYSSAAVSPMCDGASLHNLHSLPAQGRSGTPIIPPPPYSFGTKHSSSSLASSDVLSSQPPYSMDPPTSVNTFIDPLSNIPMSSHSSTSLPTPISAVSLASGPSSISPTLSPITNSDCSLTETSPLTRDVPLSAPTLSESFPSAVSTSSHPDVLSLQDEGSPLVTHLGSSHTSPIHAKDPVALTNLHDKEWELFSNSLCPVIQTDHDMWVSNPPQMLANSNKAGPPLSTSNSDAPRQFSGMYGMDVFPQYSSETVMSQQYPVSSVSNGAK